MLRALTAVCGLLVILLLAACGGGDDDDGSGSRTTPSAAGREEEREKEREQSASEFRGEANDLCDRYNLALVRRTKLPSTRAQERRRPAPRVHRPVAAARALAHVDGPKARSAHAPPRDPRPAARHAPRRPAEGVPPARPLGLPGRGRDPVRAVRRGRRCSARPTGSDTLTKRCTRPGAAGSGPPRAGRAPHRRAPRRCPASSRSPASSARPAEPLAAARPRRAPRGRSTATPCASCAGPALPSTCSRTGGRSQNSRDHRPRAATRSPARAARQRGVEPPQRPGLPRPLRRARQGDRLGAARHGRQDHERVGLRRPGSARPSSTRTSSSLR